MPPALDETSQLIPSQFSHLRTTEPRTTSSGIAPGQALLDTPSPDRFPPVLERSQRTRKPSTRKAEASQAQPGTSKSKGKEPAKTTASKNIGNASNASTTKSSASLGSQAGSAGVARRGGRDIGPEDEDENGEPFLSHTVIELVEAFVGHNVDHLSDRQIQNLLDTMPATQEATLETQAKPTPAITQSNAGLGPTSGDRNGLVSPQGPGSHSSPQRQNDCTTGGTTLSSQKRPLNTSHTPANSKRVRISQDDSDSSTEDQTDNESDLRRRRRRANSPDDEDEDDDDDDDADDDKAPPPSLPLPPSLSQSRKPLAGSKGQTTTKPTLPKPTLAAPRTAPTRPLSRTSTNPIASTSSTNPIATSSRPTNATSYIARHPPPADLSDINALTAWALKITQERTQGLETASPSVKRHLPTQPTCTVDHVAQAIASHRSQSNGANRPGLHDPSSRPSQPPHTNSIPRAPTPGSDDTPSPNTGIAPSQHKTKRSAKAKLSDYPGCVGEVASAAIPYFLATVLIEGAYENLETFRNWALDSYQLTWNIEFPEYEYEVPPRAVLTIMTRRVTWLRGEMKKRIRTIVEYGYGFRNPAVTRADIKHNRRLSKKLAPNVFHCRDLEPNTDHFEHVQFVRAISAGLFWDPESIGVVFHDRFELVPIPAAALILTMMQACINEWRAGNYKADELDADKQQVEYERHLQGLYEYEKGAAGRLTRFRKSWAAAGLKYSGANPDEDPTANQPYVLASQVRPDTPPPECSDGQALGV